MAKLVKCKKCEYLVAKSAKTCLQCNSNNPGLDTTHYFISLLLIISTIAVMMGLYKASIEEPLISLSDVEAAGFYKHYQRHTLIDNAKSGWVGEWRSERIELYQFDDTIAVDLEFFSKHAAPDNVFGWNDACIHKNIIVLSEGRSACMILKQL